MKYKSSKPLTTEDKNDLISKYQEEVDAFTLENASRILDLINNGDDLPVWEKPVFNTFFLNPASGTKFNLENSLLLFMSMKGFDYKKSLFITAKQGFDNGMSMEKGTKGHYIIQRFGMKMFPLTQSDASGKPAKDSNGKTIYKRNEEGEIQYLYKRCAKLVKIFNIEQFTGPIPDKWLKYMNTNSETLTNQEDLDKIKNVVLESLPIEIVRTVADGNYYIPLTDKMYIYSSDVFKNTLRELSTIFHEWSHATGHSTRLNRESLNRYAESKEFRGYEELVANFAARRLCNHYNLSNNELSESFNKNHDVYDAGWAMRAIKTSPEAIFKAASDADRAFNMITRTIEPMLKNDKDLTKFLTNKIEAEEGEESPEVKVTEKRKPKIGV
jgi:antirestriction protein ArdC